MSDQDKVGVTLPKCLLMVPCGCTITRLLTCCRKGQQFLMGLIVICNSPAFCLLKPFGSFHQFKDRKVLCFWGLQLAAPRSQRGH